MTGPEYVQEEDDRRGTEYRRAIMKSMSEPWHGRDGHTIKHDDDKVVHEEKK
jgi:hypothetical protein